MDKKLAFTGFFLLCTLLSATAQQADSLRILPEPPSAGAGEPIGEVENELVTMRRGSDDSSVVLEVAGFGLTLGRASDTETGKHREVKSYPRVCGVFCDGIELGFNTLVGLDYAGYPAGTEDFLDVRPGNSFHFGITPVGLDIDLDRKRKFGFSTGLRYTVDNYRLSNNSITLGREDGRIVPVALDEPAGKSKLRITSLGFPLQFSCEPVRHLNIAVVGYCDFTVGINSIYKKPKVKNGLSGVNPFRFGIGGAVSYRGFGVYVRYGITPLFRSSAGPTCHPLSFGVCIFM